MVKKLDLGCGKKKPKEFIGVDIKPFDCVDIVWDLNVFPWEFAKDNEFDVIRMNHSLEHLFYTEKVFGEIYRIAKPRARVIIAVPHFSSYLAYSLVGHYRQFACRAFESMKPKFRVKKMRLNWGLKFSDGSYENPFKEILRKFLNFLANLDVHFCERVWCYYVGGFNEICTELEVMK